MPDDAYIYLKQKLQVHYVCTELNIVTAGVANPITFFHWQLTFHVFHWKNLEAS